MDIFYKTYFGSFEWDSNKNKLNLQKHKIDFFEAIKVFSDDYSIIYHDDSHSIVEDRYKIVGNISGFRLVAVFFTDRDEVTRIISARKVTRNEKEEYEQNLPD